MSKTDSTSVVLKIKDSMMDLAPKFEELGVSNEVFLKEVSFAMQALGNNSALAKCDKNSKLAAVFNLALTGLSLSPALGYAYLVPRGGKCVLDISYKGFVYLATLSGGITSVNAECIYEGDEFDAEEGSNPRISHKPNYFGERGKFLGVYCVATLADGTKKHEIMNNEEIEKCRAVSAMRSGAIWKTWTDEMRKKTVIRRARKLWPHCEKLAKAAEVQNETDGFEPIQRQLKPNVEMPKALSPVGVADAEQPEDFESETDEPQESSESDKLFMEVKEWEGSEILEKVLKKFPNKSYPKDYSTGDLETVLKLCKSLEEKKGK